MDPPSELSSLASFVPYLVTIIPSESFVSMFSSITTQHSLIKGKEKQSFRSNSAAFIIASRTVYARTKFKQTTAFELSKLLQ